METNIEQKVAEGLNNTQMEKVVDGAKVNNTQQGTNSNKKPLTPYQKYKNSRNQNGKKYFEFYDDIKVYTHNIWDW